MCAIRLISLCSLVCRSFRDLSYNYDPAEHEEQQESYGGGHGGIVAFPDLLAPAARMETDTGYMPDYGFLRDRPRSHTSPFYDTNSFNVSSSAYRFRISTTESNISMRQ